MKTQLEPAHYGVDREVDFTKALADNARVAEIFEKEGMGNVETEHAARLDALHSALRLALNVALNKTTNADPATLTVRTFWAEGKLWVRAEFDALTDPDVIWDGTLPDRQDPRPVYHG